MPALLARLLPPPGIARPLALQSASTAAGTGIFLTGSAVFFTRVVGLSAAQVGTGLSVAGVAAFVATVPLGTLADRLGARRTWLVAVLVEAALFAAYPLVHGFVPFVAIVVAVALADALGGAGRGAYLGEVLTGAQRLRTQAYTRAAFNVGYSLGAAASGVALAVDTRWGYYALVLGNAASFLLDAVFILRFPRTGRAAPVVRDRRFAALRDLPFVAVASLNGGLSVHITLMSLVLPLWLLDRTDAPRGLVAVMALFNTVLAVALQVTVSRGADTPAGAGTALRRAGLALSAGCVVAAATVVTHGALTIAALLVAVALVTAAELYQSAGAWGVSYALAPAHRRAEYLGTFQLGTQAQNMIAPAGLTYLVVTLGWPGWLILGAGCAILGLAAPRIGRRAWRAREPVAAAVAS